MRQAASVTIEAEMTVQLLPRCKACHHPHPLALHPPKPATVCPNCGGPASPAGEASLVEAALGGADPLLWLGAAMVAVGRWLHKLAKGGR